MLKYTNINMLKLYGKNSHNKLNWLRNNDTYRSRVQTVSFLDLISAYQHYCLNPKLCVVTYMINNYGSNLVFQSLVISMNNGQADLWFYSWMN